MAEPKPIPVDKQGKPLRVMANANVLITGILKGEDSTHHCGPISERGHALEE
jgi:hypothetical protein